VAEVVLVCADCEGTREQVLRIWNVFERREVKANFFFTGKTVTEQRGLAREIARAHHVDSHTFSHANLRRLSRAQQRDEILRGKDAVEDVIGRETQGFRAPFDAINRDTVDILNEEHLRYDVSGLYHRYDMLNVIEVTPSWFREWTTLYEWLRLTPRFGWDIVRRLFFLFDPLVIPVHPHYSGRDDLFAAAMEDSLIFARHRSARFLSIPEYLDLTGR
jgi:peptidoglycan/xylan/chitin deacetylase (PgdA/CDA1 family)